MGTSQSSPEDGENIAHFQKLEEIKFRIHDQEHTVKTSELTPNTSLNTYLRKYLHLTGTKVMCREGGCGSCVVVLQSEDPVTKKKTFLAVNSCLLPILSCNGWTIYTVEGIGNPKQGYHQIQKALANFNGTQCGFCSSGMVMNMYALYESGKLTMQDVENSFSGNLCRCTGYRPILAAFKSLTTDVTPDILGTYEDIEDLKVCERSVCQKECESPTCTRIIIEPFYHHLLGDAKWIKVHTLKDLQNTLRTYSRSSYRLVAGNTAQGVYKEFGDPVDVYIEITSVSELTSYEMKNGNLVLGANITLTDAIELFKIQSSNNGFSYLKQMADHIDLVANVPVRNRGTLAGNLIIKHNHHEFPSDIFLLLETVGAKLSIVNVNGNETAMTPHEFISYDMNDKILRNITLPPYSKDFRFVSYKIMPRAQNVHAYVNAGFLFKLNSENNVESSTIVFGNINANFVHAKKSEQILTGKNLFSNDTIQEVCASLSEELNADVTPPDPSPQFRKQLAIALFYKTVLFLCPQSLLTNENKSGGAMLERPVSKGTQDFETKKSLYPLTQPVTKLEALAQTTGQAEYIDDMPDLPNQLYGALVLTEAPPNSSVTHINPKRALKKEGIVAFYTKDDIPGDNNFTPLSMRYLSSKEEIFCSGKIKYYQQPVGILVGKSQESVENATSLVEITYHISNVEPLLSTRQILKANRKDRIKHDKNIPRKKKGSDVKKTIEGTFDIYHQYHFHMELQCCNVVPTEDGLTVYPASQWMEATQAAIANMLDLPNSKIYIHVRRCGGGFGAKVTRNGLVSCAAALASWKLKQPVRLSLPLSTNIAVLGKRFPLSTDYKVAVNDNGVIQYLDCTHYSDCGAQTNEEFAFLIGDAMAVTYNADSFKVDINNVITDTHVNTYARAPGTLEAVAMMEALMDHIAYEVGIDPLDVRMANLNSNSPLLNLINDLKSWADIDNRKRDINNFNQANRWKKKGLSVTLMTFEFFITSPFSAMVSILHDDGTVQISHGGIEIGQGINTKAAQVCAYKLGLTLDQVQVLPSNSFTAANAMMTGGSITSEAVCFSVIQACDVLLERIKPFREEMGNPEWKKLIEKCFQKDVDLTARGFYTPNNKSVQTYNIYGVCAAEVIVDVLTGQHIVSRVDLLEDVGQAISPLIDIGQIEGGFIMGVGYQTIEQQVYNYEGKILTNNTWTYYIPGAKDIPVNFNVKFPKNNPNPVGVLYSKATGEPPICLSVCVPLAIRNALASARSDANPKSKKWFPFDGPTNIENIFMNSSNDIRQYRL